MMLSIEEKKKLLENAFKEFDTDQNNIISINEMLYFLDQSVGREFDRDIAFQLFEQIDQNHDQKINLGEFENIFIQAEEILNRKINMLKE